MNIDTGKMIESMEELKSKFGHSKYYRLAVCDCIAIVKKHGEEDKVQINPLDEQLANLIRAKENQQYICKYHEQCEGSFCAGRIPHKHNHKSKCGVDGFRCDFPANGKAFCEPYNTHIGNLNALITDLCTQIYNSNKRLGELENNKGWYKKEVMELQAKLLELETLAELNNQVIAAHAKRITKLEEKK